MQPTRLITIIAILLTSLMCISSCTVVDKVYFEVLRPADTVVNINVKDIDIVNRHFINNSKPLSNTDYDKWQLDSLISFECIKAVNNIFKDGERFKPVRVDTICNMQTSTNNRIELKLVDLKTEILREPTKDYYSGLYLSSVMVEYFVAWEVISNANHIVYKRSFHDTVWVEGAKASFLSLYDLVDFDKAVNHIVNRCAVLFAKKIAPHWQKTYRYIYASGNNDFVMAHYYVTLNQWDRAESLWYRYVDSGNKTLAGKANYNLAVKSEKEGLLLNAIEFAKKSQELGFAPASELMFILQARINSIAIIESQIP